MLRRIWRVFDPEGGIGGLWCSLMHDSPRWPVHGHYECGVCGRRYRVPWAEAASTGAAQVRRPPFRPLPSAMVPVVVLIAVLARPSLGGEIMMTAPSPAAAVALERFIGNQGEAGAWPLETMEIEASLPKLKKAGRLLAIRRLLPVGQPDYQVLRIAGDSTVKHQVIVRYLSADEKASQVSVPSVALTPANYKIHYAGAVRLAGGLAYAFRVIPRKKRDGLIDGVLWLDSETGIAVRESGHLAKSPSVFLKRINLTRESKLVNGMVAERITHLSVETRLVGRAQLIIVERPGSEDLASRLTAAEAH
jgi:hypothetical protein